MENETQNHQIPVTSSTPQPLSPAPKSKLPLILVGLVLLLLGGAYYLGRQKNKTTSQALNSNMQPTTTSQNNTVTDPTETPIATQNDETVNWKTYASSILSFKYPTTLTLEERQKNYIVLLSDANNPQSVLVSIDARRSGNYADFDNAINTTKAGLTYVQTEDLTNGVKISGKIGPGYSEGQAVTIAIFKYGIAAVEAETTTTNQSQLLTFNKIISTFKFTQ